MLLHDKYLDIGKLFGDSLAGRATTGHAHTEQMRVERLFVRVSSLGKVASESVIRVFVFGCRGQPVLCQGSSAPEADNPIGLSPADTWGRRLWHCLVSLGLSRRHFLVVFVGHVFPEGEGRDETLAADCAQIWHAPVLTVRVGHVNGEPVLLGKLLGAERARETVATTGPVHAEHVLVERLLVGVSSGAKVAFERVV